ncbi:MAG: sulfite exporter TauE/SafE family protein [Woeseiaceae bacterium]|nr:sulfite exporter TauE/SafE family protein [Woeseiaceae bacterium]
MIADLGLPMLAAIAVAAFASGMLHGTTGMAGGVVMAAFLAHPLGVKAAVPVMTVALIISHLSRALLYARDTDWGIAGRVLLYGCPTIVLGAIVFGLISPVAVSLVFAAFLAASFPVKAWARKHEVRTGPKLLAGASAVWGMLAGNVIGPGFFLAPFLLGTGMNRLTFVGTLATVTLVMNVVKAGVFGATDLVTAELAILGAGIGVLTIPGNWAGRRVLRKMADSDHRMIIDILTVLMILNFLYLAIR